MNNQFNERLNGYISLVESELAKVFKRDGLISDLTEPMEYSLLAGGKRIRPVLCLEFARINGGDVQKALPFAMAVEMIHTYSLIHDDLPCMDNDDFRRGRPSCHKMFGEATALLAGDGLLTLAFETIASAPAKYNTDYKACVLAAEALSGYAGMAGMVGGQVLDIQNENSKLAYEELLNIYMLKTSALIKAACTMGVFAANGSKEAELTAIEYAENLGFAFQNIDDILDVEGDFEDLGKKTGMDENKTTFVTLLGMDRAKQLAEETTKKALAALDNTADGDFLKELTTRLLSRSH